MASATPSINTSSVKFNPATGCETSRAKVKKKFQTGTIGPAAARALSNLAVYATEKGEIYKQKMAITVTPAVAPRSGVQSPEPKKDP